MSHPLERDFDHILAHTGDIWDALKNRRIFLTGGTGFVGAWLVESLAWANDRLRLNCRITLLSRDPAAFLLKAPEAASHPCVEYIQGDAASFSFPLGDYPFVIHASTERQFDATPDLPTGMFDADVAATRHVLEFARSHGTQRLLFTSSGAAYGPQPTDLAHMPEEYAGAPPTNDPRMAYGEAKRIGEWLCSAYSRQYGFAALLPRLFAFVGPYLPLRQNYAVGNFVADILERKPVRIAGDGTPLRSYLYAADMAIWLWTILLRGESCRIYNVGSSRAVSIADLARDVVRATIPATSIQIAKEAVPGVPPARYVPSVTRADLELGLRPHIDLEEGIRRTYAWHRRAAIGLQ